MTLEIKHDYFYSPPSYRYLNMNSSSLTPHHHTSTQTGTVLLPPLTIIPVLKHEQFFSHTSPSYQYSNTNSSAPTPHHHTGTQTGTVLLPPITIIPLLKHEQFFSHPSPSYRYSNTNSSSPTPHHHTGTQTGTVLLPPITIIPLLKQEQFFSHPSPLYRYSNTTIFSPKHTGVTVSDYPHSFYPPTITSLGTNTTYDKGRFRIHRPIFTSNTFFFNRIAFCKLCVSLFSVGTQHHIAILEILNLLNFLCRLNYFLYTG